MLPRSCFRSGYAKLENLKTSFHGVCSQSTRTHRQLTPRERSPISRYPCAYLSETPCGLRRITQVVQVQIFLDGQAVANQLTRQDRFPVWNSSAVDPDEYGLISCVLTITRLMIRRPPKRTYAHTGQHTEMQRKDCMCQALLTYSRGRHRAAVYSNGTIVFTVSTADCEISNGLPTSYYESSRLGLASDIVVVRYSAAEALFWLSRPYSMQSALSEKTVDSWLWLFIRDDRKVNHESCLIS